MLRIYINSFICLRLNRLGLLQSMKGWERKLSRSIKHCLGTVLVILQNLRRSLYFIGIFKSKWLPLKEERKNELKCSRGFMVNASMNLFMGIKTVIMRKESRRRRNQNHKNVNCKLFSLDLRVVEKIL